MGNSSGTEENEDNKSTISQRKAFKTKFFSRLPFDPLAHNLSQNVGELIDLWNSTCCFYHAHIYFRPQTNSKNESQTTENSTKEIDEERKHALWMRREIVRMAQNGKLSCDVGPLLDKPGNGPHTWSYFEVQFEISDFGTLATWLQFNHKTNPVLFHPISVYHLQNHTTRALWLGDPQPIKVDFLRNFDADVVRGISSIHEQALSLEKEMEDLKGNNDEPSTIPEIEIKYKKIREELAHLMYTHMVPSRYGISSVEILQEEGH